MHQNQRNKNHKGSVANVLCKFSTDVWRLYQLFTILSLIIFLLIIAGPASAQAIPTQKNPKVLTLNNQGDTSLALPSDVAVHDEKIYVVDGSHHRVVVYNLQGKYLFDFGGKGDKPGQMNYPVGIDAAIDNRIYVADSGNRRVQVFTDRGKYLSSFKVNVKNKPVRPIDIIRHSRSGNIIVSGGNRLLIYSAKGKLLKEWGSNGISQGEFRYPAILAELNDGRIAVVDVLNSRVQVFNQDGTVSMVVGEWGVLPGQLFRPKGVAIDHKGNFYVSDSYMNVVQKYSDGGEFIAVLGEKGKSYEMLTPVGMTVYKNKLYVVEMRNHQVSVYQLVK